MTPRIYIPRILYVVWRIYALAQRSYLQDIKSKEAMSKMCVHKIGQFQLTVSSTSYRAHTRCTHTHWLGSQILTNVSLIAYIVGCGLLVFTIYVWSLQIFLAENFLLSHLIRTGKCSQQGSSISDGRARCSSWEYTYTYRVCPSLVDVSASRNIRCSIG